MGGITIGIQAATGTEARRTPRRYGSPEELCRCEQIRLLRLLTASAVDPDLAADALQEALVQLFVSWEQVGGYENQVGWVLRVAIRRLRNQERSIRRKAAALLRLSGVPDGQGAGTDQAAQHLDLVRAIRKLPARRRLILALFYLEDLPVAEIASLLGITQGSVTRQLYRGREALRQELEV